MKKTTISIDALASVSNISDMKEVAWEEVKKSFESFCMMVGVESLTTMFEVDAKEIYGHRHGRGAGKRGHRWGTTQGTARFQGGTIDVDRPRVGTVRARRSRFPVGRRRGMPGFCSSGR